MAVIFRTFPPAAAAVTAVAQLVSFSSASHQKEKEKRTNEYLKRWKRGLSSSGTLLFGREMRMRVVCWPTRRRI